MSDPSMWATFEGRASTEDKPWAAHEEVLRGGLFKFSKVNYESLTAQSFEYSNTWRQVTGLRQNASPTVRDDAGDSVKSAVKYTFTKDTRNNPLLPQSGYLFKSGLELAGVGPLAGDVAFAKGDMDLAGAVRGPLGTALSGGLRFGMLYPLPLGSFGRNALPSRISDRFLLGGPTDVRGFATAGLGPHDGQDGVGGDVFAAGSVNMFLPIPYRNPDSGLRFHIFANGGRLVALKNKGKGRGTGEGMDAGTVRAGMNRAFQDLVSGPPSIATGIGLVYAHPVARFELNFSLPLVLRRHEQGTKGFQVGVGINFL
jgi:outer membrane protein insertion porin family